MFLTYQTLPIVMVDFLEDNRAFVYGLFYCEPELVFDLKTETIGKLLALTFSHLMGVWWGKMLSRTLNESGWVSRCVVSRSRSEDFIATVNTAIFE